MSPFLIRRLPSSIGTSSTRPLTCDTIGTVYRKTRIFADEGATTLSVRIMIVRATIGMVTTMTCDVMFHGSHLSLMKISQTKNA